MRDKGLHPCGPQLHRTLDLDEDDTVVVIGQQDIGEWLPGLTANAFYRGLRQLGQSFAFRQAGSSEVCSYTVLVVDTALSCVSSCRSRFVAILGHFVSAPLAGVRPEPDPRLQNSTTR